MIETLVANPLLVLFVVVAIGYPLGRLKVAGFSLGAAAVLFAGLAVGSLDPNMTIPSVMYLFGLLLFVYTIGLAGGPSFFASFQRQGLRDNAMVVAVLLFAALLTAGLTYGLGLPASLGAGLFAGSLTNTPALASLLELLEASPTADPLPTIAYAVAYPVGVIGVIIVLQVFQNLTKTDYPNEAKRLKDLGASGEHLVNVTIKVIREDIGEYSVEGWRQRGNWQVIFGRVRRAGEINVVFPHSVLHFGDEVSIIGADEDVAQVAAFLGEVSEDHLEFERSQLDFRRLFVSNPDVAQRTLAELKMPERYGCLITRVRRGDLDLLPHADMRLELGDRVRVVARREAMPGIVEALGDSYRAVSEIDMVAFSLGIALGLLVGLIPIPLPNGMVFRLGVAGGPLITALILGTLGRSGRIVWQLPYSANVTLRQLGLVLFLAGVGTSSGYAFVNTLARGGGVQLFLAGALITVVTTSLTLGVGYYLFKIPMSLLLGIVSGVCTQPAVLAFAGEQTHNDLPNIGYATVFPIATVIKILLAQMLLLLL